MAHHQRNWTEEEDALEAQVSLEDMRKVGSPRSASQRRRSRSRSPPRARAEGAGAQLNSRRSLPSCLPQTSASIDLQESQSCSHLLACGLLPEELAELESGAGLPGGWALTVCRQLLLLLLPAACGCPPAGRPP